MAQLLALEGGPIVEIREQPPQGTRHRVLFGVLTGTGEPVAVKVERTPGALSVERTALRWIGASEGFVPRLLAAAMATLAGERVACLVIERRAGAPPTSIAGWQRMGRAYAQLIREPRLPPALPTFDPTTFGAAHARRIGELEELLTPLAAHVPDWTILSNGQVPGSAPLALTHGDPGPGNFLDDGHLGSIVDWEHAQVAPRGLDLARLVFIALLGAGPRGYVGRDEHERADAVAAAYLDAVRDQWQPSRGEARWWTAAAGVQFIHSRWRLGGPAPWHMAADVLRAALLRDSLWTGA